MVAPTSATGGYLAPTSSPPLEGEQLEDFFHDLIVGITQLDPTLVRPAWQPEPPNVPVAGTNWIAFHFVDVSSDDFPFVGQVTLPDQSVIQSELQNHEEFNVHCSIYGTGAGSPARAIAKLLRDGLMVPQNQEPLFNAGMGLIGIPSAPQPVPLLVKTKWLYRVDMDIRIRRIIVRDYDVKTIDSVQGNLIAQIETNEITRTITVEDPSP
jgi:hypothetical protein